MDFHMKLPRNTKDFILFLAMVSILSVLIIAPVISGLQVGFTKEIMMDTFKVLPLIWMVVIIMVLITHPIADKMTEKIVDKGDSFNATVTVNILCNVLLMSMFMTVFGSWIGSRMISMDVFTHYFHVWPRNFGIALAVELLVAQPIARAILYKVHVKHDAKDAKKAA